MPCAAWLQDKIRELKEAKSPLDVVRPEVRERLTLALPRCLEVGRLSRLRPRVPRCAPQRAVRPVPGLRSQLALPGHTSGAAQACPRTVVCGPSQVEKYMAMQKALTILSASAPPSLADEQIKKYQEQMAKVNAAPT